MKKLIYTSLLFFCITNNAQIKSIVQKDNNLVLNDTIIIKKNSQLQINLPASKDFLFVKKVPKINFKALGNYADLVSSGAGVVGVVGGKDISILQKSIKVMQTADKIKYSSDALQRIESLPISKTAKEIAGKTANIVNWEFTPDGYVLTVLISEKKYIIYLTEALNTEEVKF